MALRSRIPAPIDALNKFGALPGGIPIGGCPSGFTAHAKRCYESHALAQRFAEYESQKREGFIPTLLEVGPYFAAGIATLLSAGAASPTLSLAGTLKAASAVGLKTLSVSGAVASLVPTSGGSNMGLNIGGLLNVAGNLLGQASSVPVLQSVGQITQAFAPAFATGPSMASGPIYQPGPVYNEPTGQPVMSTMPVIAAGAGAVARMTAPILFKVASKIGRRVSLTGTIAMIRKMGKFLMDPAAIAVALGITVGELATLITAHSARRTRHMNAANPKALRRAARRIKSFHRMCGTIDLLKSRGRRTVRTLARCVICRKNPCRC